MLVEPCTNCTDQHCRTIFISRTRGWKGPYRRPTKQIVIGKPLWQLRPNTGLYNIVIVYMTVYVLLPTSTLHRNGSVCDSLNIYVSPLILPSSFYTRFGGLHPAWLLMGVYNLYRSGMSLSAESFKHVLPDSCQCSKFRDQASLLNYMLQRCPAFWSCSSNPIPERNSFLFEPMQ